MIGQAVKSLRNDRCKVEQRSSDTCSQRSSKDVWLSRTTVLIGGIFKVVSIVKICLDIFNHYQP